MHLLTDFYIYGTAIVVLLVPTVLVVMFAIDRRPFRKAEAPAPEVFVTEASTPSHVAPARKAA